MAFTTDPFGIFKSVISVLLLTFSIVLIMALIAVRETKISEEVHPVLAYFMCWGAILWLTMVEGGQASLVGLTPVNAKLYKDSHKLAYKQTKITNKGDNLDRYLMGRQFMVVLVVFTVNMSAAPNADAELWDLPGWVMGIFLEGGLAMILFTCNVGQLNTQVNASLCMLDYCNNYFGLFTLYVAMFVEFSGLLHASYLVQLLVAKLAGKPIESKEEPRTLPENIFFWGRCLMSLAILCFCIAVTFTALFQSKTTMWDSIPPGVAVAIFFILVCVVGMLEGMQIAFFAVAKLRPEERGDTNFAKLTCNLLFKGEGNNLPGFMIGRQLCVVSCMFFVARVTSVDVDLDKGEESIFGAGPGLNNLYKTGLLGAVMLTILGSISWQLVAAAFPIAFLNFPLTYFLLRLCLLLESTGLCNAAWVIAAIHKKIAGFKRDEYYIGTAEERAKQAMEDDEDALPLGAGHMIKVPNFADHAPKKLQKLVEKDPSSVKYLNALYTDAESQHGKNLKDLKDEESA
eukprot:CAMPEP_0184859018 /NCGR_PEP_ID=MMETSP0580-20130426/4032_1 /TAXON_ID=1118495 /ORGANISM="Dactyliosolen fragilissimus" /LENGTH=513 /DNA_ID=CAMNT_0027355429 /DNA_START=64 /DNA_END=1605 /DNA_ORIENTATION=-